MNTPCFIPEINVFHFLGELKVFFMSFVTLLHSICKQIWKTQQWPQDYKKSAFILILKKGNGKEYSNYCIIALIL